MIYSMTDRPMSWQPRNTASNAQRRATQSASYYHNLTTSPLSQYRQSINPLTNLTDHHVDGTDRLLTPNTSPCHPAVEARRQRPWAIPMTYARTWTIEPVRQDQSMDQGGVLQHERMTIRPGVTGTTSPRPKTAYGLRPNYAVTSPGTEAPHTPYASPTK